MSDEISQLLVLRRRIAAMSQALQERELAGRVLRLETEARLRTDTPSMSATQAEKLARADAVYLEHERRGIAITYDRAICEAEAEALLLGIRLRTATMEHMAGLGEAG